ncbi:hypothetical protein PENSPDRAFT_708138 [Peniophora sp. CONT]|nr:hypothetical protein PENSPDRAFT_708138 [Peniophora sp. CONT]
MSHPVSSQPLKGDEHGHFRVHIVGNSGTELAHVLGVPFISLDTIHWLPGWKERSKDEFQARVAEALAEADSKGGWVVDGNYHKRLDGALDVAATDIVWLDPPFALYFPRLLWRTILRLFGRGSQCSPGCEEEWHRVFLSWDDSIIWWCITNHPVVQSRMKKAMSEDDPRVGGPGKFIRLGGWSGEQDVWMREVKAMNRLKKD